MTTHTDLPLLGKRITKIEGLDIGSEELKFYTADFHVFKVFHRQSCCEHVRLEDFEGDVEDLVGHVLTTAEQVSSQDRFDGKPQASEYCPEDDSFTWTFYRLGTDHGMMTLRFLGESNGYYGEEMEIKDLTTPEERAKKMENHLEQSFQAVEDSGRKARL